MKVIRQANFSVGIPAVAVWLVQHESRLYLTRSTGTDWRTLDNVVCVLPWRSNAVVPA